MSNLLRDVTGFRGEKIIELCLTNYRQLQRPLFRPGFLDGKWPTIDFYVELTGVKGHQPYFFVQAKATTSPIKDQSLPISTKKRDIERLLRIPGPTYILGVHEPTEKVFVQSVHNGMPAKAVSRIPTAHELTRANLLVLYNEVRSFWNLSTHKPNRSAFA